LFVYNDYKHYVVILGEKIPGIVQPLHPIFTLTIKITYLEFFAKSNKKDVYKKIQNEILKIIMY
jgi:hypothetical protein